MLPGGPPGASWPSAPGAPPGSPQKESDFLYLNVEIRKNERACKNNALSYLDVQIRKKQESLQKQCDFLPRRRTLFASRDRRLVHQVREVGAAEARGAPGVSAIRG